MRSRISAGRALGETEAGALARLVLQAALEFRPLAVQALIAHPAARFGRGRAEKDAAARALEIGVFRAAPIPALEDLDAAFEAARAAAADGHAHPAVRSIGETKRAAGERLARDCAAALGPLRALKPSTPLGGWLDAHRAALAAVLEAPERDRAAPHGLAALEALLEEWRAAAGDGFPCALGQYVRLVDDALAGVRAPPAPGGNPRLQILGLLEARLLAFDRVLIAGLDEKVWPPSVDTDAFLNRPMRAELGLSPPERRIGQTAHDFAAALGAREAILSRARKRGGEPTVASRLLLRLAAAAGAPATKAAERRGETYLAWARALDQPEEVVPVEPPAPKPPVEKRPRSLSVTRIETLRRDPYAIYAERILKLGVLPPVERTLGPREAGEAWHGALEDFAKAFPAGALPAEARAALVGFARTRFAALLRDPAFSGLDWPNIEKAIDFVIRFESESRGAIERIYVERQGALEFALSDGAPFTLTARADRIDRLADGEARLIDYKSGTPPSIKEVTIGLAPQLTLEAAILAEGGFADLGPMPPQQALYLKLGGPDGGKARDAADKGEPLARLAARHLADLKVLLGELVEQDLEVREVAGGEPGERFAFVGRIARLAAVGTAELEIERLLRRHRSKVGEAAFGQNRGLERQLRRKADRHLLYAWRRSAFIVDEPRLAVGEPVDPVGARRERERRAVAEREFERALAFDVDPLDGAAAFALEPDDKVDRLLDIRPVETREGRVSQERGEAGACETDQRRARFRRQRAGREGFGEILQRPVPGLARLTGPERALDRRKDAELQDPLGVVA